MKNMMIILILSTVVMVFCGCATPATGARSDQQQLMVNELDAKVKKLEMQLNQMQSDMNEQKKELSKLKQDVQKVKPGYIEGTTQEGGR
jgi:outer membrane murein-binding lipoprotein Lpp